MTAGSTDQSVAAESSILVLSALLRRLMADSVPVGAAVVASVAVFLDSLKSLAADATNL
jgi:hypothetical protein